MDIEIVKIVQSGDLLTIEGLVDGKPITATGWASAINNHYDPEQYDEETRHFKVEATPRKMTKEEQEAYIKQLLGAIAPQEKEFVLEE
jgi:hypothetical protein